MKHRRAHRRDTTAKPYGPLTEAKWRKLVKACLGCAEDPLDYAKAEALADARNKVRGQTVPRHENHAGSALSRLCVLTDSWAAKLVSRRFDEAAELGRLARLVLDGLDIPPPDPTRAVRRRADIDDVD